MDTYGFQAWHGTLITIAVILFVSIFNTMLARRLPFVEGLLLILHMAGLFAIIIPLWVSARSSRNFGHNIYGMLRFWLHAERCIIHC